MGRKLNERERELIQDVRKFLTRTITILLSQYLDKYDLILNYLVHTKECKCKNVFCCWNDTNLVVLKWNDYDWCAEMQGKICRTYDTSYVRNLNLYTNFLWSKESSKDKSCILYELYQNGMKSKHMFKPNTKESADIDFWTNYIPAILRYQFKFNPEISLSKYEIPCGTELNSITTRKNLNINAAFCRKYIADKLSTWLETYLYSDLIKIIIRYLFCYSKRLWDKSRHYEYHCSHRNIFCNLKNYHPTKLHILYYADPEDDELENITVNKEFNFAESYRLYLDLNWLKHICVEYDYLIHETILYKKIVNSIMKLIDNPNKIKFLADISLTDISLSD